MALRFCSQTTTSIQTTSDEKPPIIKKARFESASLIVNPVSVILIFYSVFKPGELIIETFCTNVQDPKRRYQTIGSFGNSPESLQETD